MYESLIAKEPRHVKERILIAQVGFFVGVREYERILHETLENHICYTCPSNAKNVTWFFSTEQSTPNLDSLLLPPYASLTSCVCSPMEISEENFVNTVARAFHSSHGTLTVSCVSSFGTLPSPRLRTRATGLSNKEVVEVPYGDEIYLEWPHDIPQSSIAIINVIENIPRDTLTLSSWHEHTFLAVLPLDSTSLSFLFAVKTAINVRKISH